LAWGGVAVVGAGLSLPARYPLTSLLAPLVWKGVDADPAARARLATLIGADPRSPAKKLVGNDRAMLGRAWELIRNSQAARESFQKGFADLDHDRSTAPAPAFDALARLLHDRVVELVVSFNWDTGVEAAYRRRYGTGIPHGLLFKPHGDAARPDLPWVLPDEDGRLDDELRARLTAIRGGHPRALLIAGYSESDAYVVDELIVPLSLEWETVRIGPTASGPLGVARRAEDVLPQVAEALCAAEADSPWQHLSFGEQRDGLAAALRGARLGPGDVAGCPRLPEVTEVVAALQAVSAVALRGASGGGKSITAYQALSDLNDAGYEIVRGGERLPEFSTHDALTALQKSPWPTVAFVDDAQALPADLLQRLAETASDAHRVLIASTEPVPGPALCVTVAEARAVQVLAVALLDRAGDVLAHIRALDDTVGDGYLDEPLQRRIEAAAAEKLPWQFVFSLTAGWRRARQAIVTLRDADRADLAFLAVAVRQIASVDAGAPDSDLERLATLLGRDVVWLRTALELLRRTRHVTGDRRLRAAHVRMAMATVRILLHPPVWPMPKTGPDVPPIVDEAARSPVAGLPITRGDIGGAVDPRLHHPDEAADRSAVASLLTDALNDPATSLRGALWILDTVSGPEVRWALAQVGTPTPATLADLAARALASSETAEYATATFLLTELLRWDHDRIVDALANAQDTLVEWVRTVSPATAWGLARLFNDLGRSDPDLTQKVLQRCDPTALARSVSTTNWADASAWAELAGRLAYAGGQGFAEELAAALDPIPLRELYAYVPARELLAIADLTEQLYFLRPELGTPLAASAATPLAAHISAAPVSASADLLSMFWWPLGLPPSFLRKRAPTADQRRAARSLARRIDSTRVAAAVSSGNRRAWETLANLLAFLAEADPAIFVRVAAAVDVDELERRATGLWTAAPRELMLMLQLLAYAGREAAARELVERHADDLNRLSTALIVLAPAAGVAALRRGIPLDLGIAAYDWRGAAQALIALKGEDAEVAALVLAANRDTLLRGLQLRGGDAARDLETFLAAADTIAPDVVDDALAAVDPETVAGWREHLRRRDKTRQIVCALALRTAGGSGPAAGTAAAMLRRFPSLAPLLKDSKLDRRTERHVE
jgi:hypothetical protein